ncbi:hypothetical protein [Actinoplanes derwentensis]|uniref:Uncharacterized protein n=1 Tax=Actinoplanes derwentensis TaxID=113562 RepID=A0A1H2CGU0_9ACTN|nr:hypothetical protein [Actinoplanes derwentensis]GID88755.1 hypothetical protein Ade03nite_76790 [Actinoplanes derwentensis]SDT69564.1 hypothetical protein SAMN04489716_5790 [Actinoplanes derwentensis]
MGESEWVWPAAELAALRLGRRLGVRLPASLPHRWALVHVVPVAGRGFDVEHWEFEADSLEGYDHDPGAVRLRHETASDEAGLLAVLREWDFPPARFRHSWDSVGPR